MFKCWKSFLMIRRFISLKRIFSHLLSLTCNAVVGVKCIKKKKKNEKNGEIVQVLISI